MQTREQVIQRLKARAETDVLIIGGGINGVGLYRDLAAQGVVPVLVERGDFCSGTSSAPSRLAHGGLRYLETGEFGLVRESVAERDTMMRNAPHLVKPLKCWIPLSGTFRGLPRAAQRFLGLQLPPGPKGALLIRAGLTMYDRFAGSSRVMPRHRMVSRSEVHLHMPDLAPSVEAAAEYYDARITSPERFVVELVADAERDQADAVAIPYLSVEGCESGCIVLKDMLSGESHAISARVIVNTGGAWVDTVDASLGIDERLTGGTKGSHLVLRSAALAAQLADRMLYFETSDYRACLAYRLRADLVLLGTTDIRTDDPDDRICSAEEIGYLLKELARIMPGMSLRREDVVLTFAGVRPLPRSDAEATGSISRDHYLKHFPPTAERPFALITLVGGKWTTYRACAEQMADAVLSTLGEPRRMSTARLPVGGGRDWPDTADPVASLADDLARHCKLPRERALTLAERYGTRASEIAAEATGDKPLASLPTYGHAEIAFIVRQERVTRLADLVLRRTLIAFDGLATGETLRELADICAEALAWSAARCASEIRAAEELLEREYHATLGVSLLRATG